MGDTPTTLAYRLDLVDRVIASGFSPFQAMACSLEEEDWTLVLEGFRTRAQIELATKRT